LGTRGHERLKAQREVPICRKNVIVSAQLCTPVPPLNLHGKEGVSGSSPSEGLQRSLAKAGFLSSRRATHPPSRVRDKYTDCSRLSNNACGVPRHPTRCADAVSAAGFDQRLLLALAGRGSAVAGRGSALAGRASRVAGRASRVAGRGSAVAGRASRVPGRGSAVAGRAAALARSGAALARRSAALAGRGSAVAGRVAAAAGRASRVTGCASGKPRRARSLARGGSTVFG
jgi:hypothetical protein